MHNSKTLETLFSELYRFNLTKTSLELLEPDFQTTNT